MNVERSGMELTGCRIVVIEDDLVLRDLLISIIDGRGAASVGFNNAEDALVYLLEQQGQCDLVIADHGVPGTIKGLELAEMIKQKWATLPVLLTSGYPLDTEHLPAPVSFLFKPWSIEELDVALAQLLPEWAGRGQSSSGLTP